MKLNDEQEQAAQGIVDFLTDPFNDKPYFVLTGAAGTGKTYMLKEALERVSYRQNDRTAAAVAHAAKNVLNDALGSGYSYFTVAQWLGLNMSYTQTGEVKFVPNHRMKKRLEGYRLAILDEASMIDDDLYYKIMDIVQDNHIKLIVVGDPAQLPPVGQDHDSIFFDNIDARLTMPVRFQGPIDEVSSVYRSAIKEINDGYASNLHILNTATNREDRIDDTLNSGVYFKNNIYELVDQVADEIKAHGSNDINYSRFLAFKNETVRLLNNAVRKKMYGKDRAQFEKGEIVISNGGYRTKNYGRLIYNREVLRVDDIIDIIGPHGVPCVSVKLSGTIIPDGVNIPVVKDTPEAQKMYNDLLNKYKEKAIKDPSLWKAYYDYIASFAWFDYAYAVNAYVAQGQTLTNVYVTEGEIMSIKPLTLKQKFQALYVATTRPKTNLYIYNKDY